MKWLKKTQQISRSLNQVQSPQVLMPEEVGILILSISTIIVAMANHTK
jgi:hypothetical protein